ncbi:hypothetical protein [Cytobacillus praedii]|uniref:hypothetical protein n=1 Tax=Cytobacillus praedii TaxID=1742358 RepID=UPI002E237664|nr:hypothetical protein [Cytobacillus praedii]
MMPTDAERAISRVNNYLTKDILVKSILVGMVINSIDCLAEKNWEGICGRNKGFESIFKILKSQALT